MIEGILIGLKTALTFQNILMVMIGCFFGTIIGMLPGLGPMTAIALMIPITYGFDPATGLILMAGVYYGAVFGGSTSSILLNAPGVPGTVATSFDGYPMAQQGKAGKALAIAAYSSFAGGTLAATLNLIRNNFEYIEIEEVAFLIELDFLNGRKKLKDVPVHSLIHY